MPLRIKEKARRAWELTYLAAKGFLRIDGTHWASSFAYHAFFSLFPLITLFVTVASVFVARETAGQAIIAYVESYVPLDDPMRARVFGAIAGVIEARQGAGLLALLILIWAALQCFTTLVSVTNRAWGEEGYSWWRLPLKGMALLGVTAGIVLLGMAAPALAKIGKLWFVPANELGSWVSALWSFAVPVVLLFLSLALFYRLAPRRPTRFAEVWVAAAFATVLLKATESLFVVYLEHFARLNAVYGVFGGIMAFLLWIYLSGCAFIFGACLCAARAGGSAPVAAAELDSGTEERARQVQPLNDEENLLKNPPAPRLADKKAAVARETIAVGEFVAAGAPLVSVAGPGRPEEVTAADLNEVYVISRHRTVQQDAGFGIRQLVDIGVKALSPGVNDRTPKATPGS